MKQLARRIKYNPILLVIVLILVVAIGYLAVNTFAGNPSKVQSVKVTDLGRVANPNAPYLIRDGGATGLLGGRILWTFGDTLFTRTSVAGVNNYSNTAGYAELANPTSVSEPLDAKGAPSTTLLPLNAEESAYNQASGSPSERYALWPMEVIKETDSTSLILYTRLKVHPGKLNYELLGTGVARLQAGQTTAQRLIDGLFTGQKTQYNNGYVEADGYVYLYNCQLRAGSFSSDCSVARAPKSRVLDSAAYTFWDGASWNGDITKAAKTTPGSTSGFSVSYNPYLQSYISVSSIAFSKDITIRTSPRPEGPWSDATTIFSAPSAIYATTEHPELATDGGRSLAVSYYKPDGNGRGEMRLIRVELNPSSGATSGSGVPVPSSSSSSASTSAGPSASYQQGAQANLSQNGSTSAESQAEPQQTTTTDTDWSSKPAGFWQQVWWFITWPWRFIVNLF